MQPFRLKKGIDYYVRVLISASLALFIYGLIEVLWRENPFWESVMEFWYLPIFVTLFLWFYNTMSDKLYSKMDSVSEEKEFLFEVSRAVKQQLEYEKEDFKQLKENEKFQKLLEDAYKVFRDGESETLNYETLKARFKDDQDNKVPADVVIEKTKQLREKYKAPRK